MTVLTMRFHETLYITNNKQLTLPCTFYHLLVKTLIYSQFEGLTAPAQARGLPPPRAPRLGGLQYVFSRVINGT